MSQMLKRCGISLIALLGFALGMTASAQALPHYRIDNVPIETSEEVTRTSGIVQLMIPESEDRVSCKTQKVQRTIAPKGQSTGLFEFSGCLVIGAPCTVTEAFSFEVKGRLMTHEEKTYELFEPVAGKVFTTLNFSGAECKLPGKAEVAGSFAALTQGEEVSNSLIFSQGIDALVCSIVAPCGLTLDAGKAHLQGIWTQVLSGTNKEKPWEASSATEFFIEGTPLAPSTESIALSGGLFVFDIPTYYGSPEIRCQNMAGTGTIESKAKSSVTLNFEECILVGFLEGAYECNVKEVFAEGQISGVPATEAGSIWTLTSKENESIFIGFTVSSEACIPGPGKYAMAGKGVAPAEEGESPGHSLTFPNELSEIYPEYKFRFGSYPMFITGTINMWLTGPHAFESWGFS